MKLTIDAGEKSLFVQSIREVRSAEAPRTGIHCSQIINDMIARNADKVYDPMPEATALAFQEFGNAVEDWAAIALMRRFPEWTKPEPRTIQGMICSPDGWSPREKCIDEVKALWKSTKDFIQLTRGRGLITYNFQEAVELAKDGCNETWEVVASGPKFQGYIDQTFTYMVPWNARRARLHAFFVCGNFRPPFPEPVTLNLRPSQEEVSLAFNKVIRHGIDMRLLHE